VQPQRSRHEEGRAGRGVEAIEEPQALLRVRGRDETVARHGSDRARAHGRRRGGRDGEGRQRRVAEHGPQRQVATDRITQVGDDLDGE
jgi:hypothetical protein